MTESMESRLNSSGTSSQDSLRCSSAVKSMICWATWEKHQKLSQEEFYLCRCSTTFPVARKAMKKNAWQMSKSSPYLQRSLVLDSGHLLVQVPKRNGILWKRIVHKEFGITSRKRCCWNLQKADVQFSVRQLHCQGVSSKAKDRENCLYILLRIKKQLRLLFRTITSANQLSLYGAVAEMCEEYESLHDRSGQPDVLMGQSIVLSEIKAEVPLENDIPSHQNLLLQRCEERIEKLSQENKVSKFVWMQDSYMLLRLDSISWLRTLENNSLRRLVVNTLFQEMTDHQNRKDGYRDTRELDPFWKLRPVVYSVNMELRWEFGLWVKTTLNPVSEFLMDQINSWLIRTTTTQKFLQIYLKNKRHLQLWRILQPDRRQKQNHKEENLLIYRASF